MASVQSRPTLTAALCKAQLHRSWVRPRHLNTCSQRSPSALDKTLVPLSEHAVPSQVYTSLLTHSCCPQPQGTPRQPQASWVERKGTHMRPVSRDASEGAGVLGIQTAFHTSQQSPRLGEESWQTALCLLEGATFIGTREEKRATPPEPAGPSVHSPVCLLFQT